MGREVNFFIMDLRGTSYIYLSNLITVGFDSSGDANVHETIVEYMTIWYSGDFYETLKLY